MTDEILRAARAEEQGLVAALEKQPLYQKLLAVRRIIDLYGSASPAQTTSSDMGRGSRGSRSDSQASRIRDGAAQFLRERKTPATSGEITVALERLGIEVKGKKPSAVVASYLAHSELFVSSPEGYGLAEWRQQTASSDPGESSGGSGDHEATETTPKATKGIPPLFTMPNGVFKMPKFASSIAPIALTSPQGGPATPWKPKPNAH